MANAMQKKTFKGLIAEPKNTWSVPEIQREYVWGANAPLLDHFFKDIAQQSLNYNIGFLYSYNPHIAQEKSGLVHLIDGQQRFTTLYLAAFYFSLLEGKRFEYAEKFSYRVRNSTAEFLSSLIDKVNTYEKLENLEDQTWFLSSYRRDASIQNMCALFSWLGKNYPKADGMLEKIMGVEFWNFNLNEAHQGEELYITMNSRGESLSSNENIRAYLMENENPQNKHSLGKEFDNWQEFFWKYRGSNPNADKGFNAFLAWVIFIELHKYPSDKPLYNPDGFQKVVDNLYSYAQTAELTFDKIRPYYIALEQLTRFITGGSLDKIAPKLFGDKNPFGNYLSGGIDMRGLVFLLPLLAFYSGHSQAKPNNACWVRFFYNIAFNQESQALKEMLTLACEAHTQEWVDTICLLKSPKLAEEERAKLEQLKDHPTQREEIEQLFQELENHPVTKGAIASFISKSLDDGQLNKERLNKYRAILNDCYPVSIDSRDLFRRALLAAGSYENPDQTFGLGDGYTYANIDQHRYHLCNGDKEWAESFKQKTVCYFTLFDRILGGETLDTVIEIFGDEKNGFYRIIKNPEILKFSDQKRFTFDWDHSEAGHMIHGIKVMQNTGAYCYPVPFFNMEALLSKAEISSEYKDNGIYFSIGGAHFELWYHCDEKHPFFSLWIENKQISKLSGQLDFKPESDWLYIDNLKTEDKVLDLVEKIKQILT